MLLVPGAWRLVTADDGAEGARKRRASREGGSSRIRMRTEARLYLNATAFHSREIGKVLQFAQEAPTWAASSS